MTALRGSKSNVRRVDQQVEHPAPRQGRARVGGALRARRQALLAVEDDGIGFDLEQKSEGVGITGMRERAALVGGTITFDSEPGMGTHVVLEIPVA